MKDESSAYTLRLPPEEAMAFDEVMLRFRRQLGGGRVDKAEILRAFLDMAHTDFGMVAAVAQRIEYRRKAEPDQRGTDQGRTSRKGSTLPTS
jgi:hypothetical protein